MIDICVTGDSDKHEVRRVRLDAPSSFADLSLERSRLVRQAAPYVAILIDIRVPGLLQTPIQPAVLDGFGKVHRAKRLLAGQVGDRAGDAQDLVVSPGAEAQLADRSSAMESTSRSSKRGCALFCCMCPKREPVPCLAMA